jgi:hypothetical protein
VLLAQELQERGRWKRVIIMVVRHSVEVLLTQELQERGRQWYEIRK